MTKQWGEEKVEELLQWHQVRKHKEEQGQQSQVQIPRHPSPPVAPPPVAPPPPPPPPLCCRLLSNLHHPPTTHMYSFVRNHNWTKLFKIEVSRGRVEGCFLVWANDLHASFWSKEIGVWDVLSFVASSLMFLEVLVTGYCVMEKVTQATTKHCCFLQWVLHKYKYNCLALPWWWVIARMKKLK